MKTLAKGTGEKFTHCTEQIWLSRNLSALALGDPGTHIDFKGHVLPRTSSRMIQGWPMSRHDRDLLRNLCNLESCHRFLVFFDSTCVRFHFAKKTDSSRDRSLSYVEIVMCRLGLPRSEIQFSATLFPLGSVEKMQRIHGSRIPHFRIRPIPTPT